MRAAKTRTSKTLRAADVRPGAVVLSLRGIDRTEIRVGAAIAAAVLLGVGILIGRASVKRG